MKPLIVGLDLSLTCTGCLAAPLDWGGDWSKVTAREYSATPLPKLKRGQRREVSEADRVTRVSQLAVRIGEWCWNLSDGKRREHTQVWIEKRAFSKGTNANGEGVVELHAILKFQLLRYGIPFQVVTVGECRKLLLGNVPRRGDDAKDAVQATLRAAGCPIEWGQDITDAGCVLNFAMVINGGYGFSTPRAA